MHCGGWDLGKHVCVWTCLEATWWELWCKATECRLCKHCGTWLILNTHTWPLYDVYLEVYCPLLQWTQRSFSPHNKRFHRLFFSWIVHFYISPESLLKHSRAHANCYHPYQGIKKHRCSELQTTATWSFVHCPSCITAIIRTLCHMIQFNIRNSSLSCMDARWWKPDVTLVYSS